MMHASGFLTFMFSEVYQQRVVPIFRIVLRDANTCSDFLYNVKALHNILQDCLTVFATLHKLGPASIYVKLSLTEPPILSASQLSKHPVGSPWR